MWSDLNGHLELIRFIHGKYCLIRKAPLFSLYGFLEIWDTDCFGRRHQKAASKLLRNVAAKYLVNFMSCVKAWEFVKKAYFSNGHGLL